MVGQRGEMRRMSMIPSRTQTELLPRSSLQSRAESLPSLNKMDDEVAKVSQEKQNKLLNISDNRWKDSIRAKIEAELTERVREVLDTSLHDRNKDKLWDLKQKVAKVDQVNANLLLDGNQSNSKDRRLRTLKHKHYVRRVMSMSSNNTRLSFNFNDRLSRSNDLYSMIYGLDSTYDENYLQNSGLDHFQKRMLSQAYGKPAFMEALKTGRFQDGSMITRNKDGNYVDFRGIIRSEDGPFWPPDCTPLHAAPMFKWDTKPTREPLWTEMTADDNKSCDTQQTIYTAKWRGTHTVYDSEKPSVNQTPPIIKSTLCPHLGFESRFESGNLRQARRVGQFEYELVLRTDLYTIRHTQWYFFRVTNAQPGIIYKFRIVNLLKKDSLYNQGMQPLMYSVKSAKNENVGWIRTGHTINYTRNVLHLQSPLLFRGMSYYELEWQMEFPYSDDTTYLAHCYPYTFTDLRMDINFFVNDIYRAPFMKQEVVCESRAGNAFYMLTVADDMNTTGVDKKVVMVTARVHPGETNASWMMRGFIDYITGPEPTAKELRETYTFKIIPMLNPDGVIVGNYRCSLLGRDLNRNYRRPRREMFPTVWHTKELIESLNIQSEVLLYCDLHGHSRKQNIFMYGNNTSENSTGPEATRAIVNERLFPWLLAQRCQDKFSFNGCKFQIRACKEATGRVVMWRQLRIANSFTMEASFCGTTCNQERRQFNTSDLQRMGQSFGRTIHDYHRLLSDKSYEREILVDITCHLTRQIMERRGKLHVDLVTYFPSSVNESSAGDGPHIIENVAAGRQLCEVDDLEIKGVHVQEATERQQPPSSAPTLHFPQLTSTHVTHRRVESSKFVHLSSPHLNNTKTDESSLSEHSQNVIADSKVETERVPKVIREISSGTLDSCMKLLYQLNIANSFSDSDSSDSDSESEAEVIPTNNKVNKKKQRKKKHRKNKKVEKCRTEEMGQKKVEDVNGLNARPKTATQQSKPTIPKSCPLFVSKFEGRHNNGIPCFSEERSQERATKRVTDVPLETFDQPHAHRLPNVYPSPDNPAHYLMTGATSYLQNFHSHSESSDTDGSRRPSQSMSRSGSGSQCSPQHYRGPLPVLKRYLTDPDNLTRVSSTNRNRSPSLPTNQLIQYYNSGNAAEEINPNNDNNLVANLSKYDFLPNIASPYFKLGYFSSLSSSNLHSYKKSRRNSLNSVESINKSRSELTVDKSKDLYEDSDFFVQSAKISGNASEPNGSDEIVVANDSGNLCHSKPCSKSVRSSASSFRSLVLQTRLSSANTGSKTESETESVGCKGNIRVEKNYDENVADLSEVRQNHVNLEVCAKKDDAKADVNNNDNYSKNIVSFIETPKYNEENVKSAIETGLNSVNVINHNGQNCENVKSAIETGHNSANVINPNGKNCVNVPVGDITENGADYRNIEMGTKYENIELCRPIETENKAMILINPDNFCNERDINKFVPLMLGGGEKSCAIGSKNSSIEIEPGKTESFHGKYQQNEIENGQNAPVCHEINEINNENVQKVVPQSSTKLVDRTTKSKKSSKISRNKRNTNSSRKEHPESQTHLNRPSSQKQPTDLTDPVTCTTIGQPVDNPLSLSSNNQDPQVKRTHKTSKRRTFSFSKNSAVSST